MDDVIEEEPSGSESGAEDSDDASMDDAPAATELRRKNDALARELKEKRRAVMLQEELRKLDVSSGRSRPSTPLTSIPSALGTPAEQVVD